MKLFFLFSFLVVGCALYAQSNLQFTIPQLPELIADAGKDTTLVRGSQIKLGGIVPAKGGTGTYNFSWSPVSGLDNPDVAHPVATIDSTITYTLSVNDGKTCIKSSSVTIKTSTITAINPIATELGLTIYPNPANGAFFISTQLPVNDKSLLLQLFDNSGRNVYSQTLQGNRRLKQTVSLSTLAKGLYILRLSSNKINITYKLVIQ